VGKHAKKKDNPFRGGTNCKKNVGLTALACPYAPRAPAWPIATANCQLLSSPQRRLLEKLLSAFSCNYPPFECLNSIPSLQTGARLPVIGCWVIDGESAGIGIRESDTPHHDEPQPLCPHLFTPWPLANCFPEPQ
jgi:hypothetical protein